MYETSEERTCEQQVQSGTETKVEENQEIRRKTHTTRNEAGNVAPLFAVDHDPGANGPNNGNECKQASDSSSRIQQTEDAIDVTAPDG